MTSLAINGPRENNLVVKESRSAIWQEEFGKRSLAGGVWQEEKLLGAELGGETWLPVEI